MEVMVRNKYGKNQQGENLNERTLEMDNLRIDYRAVFQETDRRVIRGKDFLLGCNFGRRGNGGWNIWHFLSVKTKKDNQIFSLETESLPRNIYVLKKTEEIGLAEIYWEGENTLAVKIQKLASLPRWFFLKIETSIPIFQVVVSAYPGETTGPPERERWCAFPSQAYNLHQETGKKVADDDSVVLYNRYGGYQDRYGNFLVFLPEEIEDCKVKGTYGVSIELTPKKDARQLRLALGYFYDDDRDRALHDFLSNSSRQISKTLALLSWEVSSDFTEWKKLKEEIDSLGKEEEVKKFLEDLGYAKMKSAAEKFMAENNYRGMIDLTEKIQELKEKVYEKLLFSYTGK